MNTKPTIIAGLALAGLVILAGCVAPAEAESTPATPQACLDALADAEAIDGHMIDALDASGRAMEAAVIWDDQGIADETEFIESITPEVQSLRASYEVAAEECRAGAQ